MVVDREGHLFAHVGAREPAPGKRSLAGNPVLSDAFRQEPRTVATHLARDVVTYVAPVVREGEPAFVIAVAQKGPRDAVTSDESLAFGLNVAGGAVTNQPVAEALNLSYVAPAEAVK